MMVLLLVWFGGVWCSCVLGYCGLQEIEEMRRRLRELEKLDFEIPPAASHGNPVANTTISVCLVGGLFPFCESALN